MTAALAGRFLRHIEESGRLAEGDRLLVAFSGGLDSSVLLHLLRFTPRLPRYALHAAHFDHRMRSGSGRDLAWCGGVAGAWGVPFHGGVAPRPARNEEDARELRYRFLAERALELEVRWVLTGHHADDQAETVLFRILRGSGPRGLRGIAETRPPGIFRPLLPFWRGELEQYAHRVGVRPIEDPTNRSLQPARNVLRREVLPRVEEAVAPGASRALVRIAALETSRERALEALADAWLGSHAEVRSGTGETALPRRPLLELGAEAAAEVVRSLLRDRGVVPSHSGTTKIVEFITRGSSGRSLQLPGGLSLAREFDRFILRSPPRDDPGVAARGEGADEGRSLSLEAEEGEGSLTLGGRSFQVRWGRGRDPGGGGRLVRLRYPPPGAPLRVRGWVPGDRIRLSYGSKKLKKLFAERRVPRSERGRIPVLANAEERIIWVPGVAVSADAEASPGDIPLYLRVRDDGDGGER